MTRAPWLRYAVIGLTAMTVLGCGPQMVNLDNPQMAEVYTRGDPRPPRVTVFRFADRRSSETSHDPRRVGTLYVEYLFPRRVMSLQPWYEALVPVLALALRDRGIALRISPDAEFQAGGALSTPLVLTGEGLDFSVESRAGTSAHVRAVVRIMTQRGRMLFERTYQGRSSGAWLTLERRNFQEDALKEAMERFAIQVASDRELLSHLQEPE